MEASPSQVPEDDSSIIDGVSYYGQPWGEGIFYGPDDLSGAGPMTIAASETVTIAVKGCTDLPDKSECSYSVFEKSLFSRACGQQHSDICYKIEFVSKG